MTEKFCQAEKPDLRSRRREVTWLMLLRALAKGPTFSRHAYNETLCHLAAMSNQGLEPNPKISKWTGKSTSYPAQSLPWGWQPF
jgi:hypothetical protein